MYTHNLFSLTPIYDYVKTIPRLPQRDKLDYSPYGKYQLVGKSLISNIPNLPGWYLWINARSEKSEVYVGKSAQGLYNRFIDRFNQEYTIFWEAVFGPHPFIEDAYTMFPQSNYRTAIENCRCKSVGTHILWVSKESSNDDECEQVERELFRIHDPLCNIKRPEPNGVYRNVAEEVAKRFHMMIKEIKNVYAA
jgi:hypothetical protein